MMEKNVPRFGFIEKLEDRQLLDAKHLLFRDFQVVDESLFLSAAVYDQGNLEQTEIWQNGQSGLQKIDHFAAPNIVDHVYTYGDLLFAFHELDGGLVYGRVTRSDPIASTTNFVDYVWTNGQEERVLASGHQPHLSGGGSARPLRKVSRDLVIIQTGVGTIELAGNEGVKHQLSPKSMCPSRFTGFSEVRGDFYFTFSGCTNGTSTRTYYQVVDGEIQQVARNPGEYRIDGQDFGNSPNGVNASPGSDPLVDLKAKSFHRLNDEQVVFWGNNREVGGGQLWVSDGTGEGTKPLTDETVHVTSFIGVIEKGLLFVGNSSDYGRELWTSDGTTEGTMRLTDDRDEGTFDYIESTGLFPRLPTYHDDSSQPVRKRFSSIVYGTSPELWATDGTPEGTIMLDHVLDVHDDVTAIEHLHDGRWAVAVRRYGITKGLREHYVEIWVSDGTVEGTQMLRSLRPEGVLRDGVIREMSFSDNPDSSAFAFRTNNIIWWSPSPDVPARPISTELTAMRETGYGDSNKDGKVDFADFLILAANFGTQSDDGADVGDFNFDGAIDFTDFLLLAANFQSE